MARSLPAAGGLERTPSFGGAGGDAIRYSGGRRSADDLDVKMLSVEKFDSGEVFLRDGDDAPMLVMKAKPNVPVQEVEPFETYTVVVPSLRNGHDSYQG